jgi:enterochelin esterase-like enzyme
MAHLDRPRAVLRRSARIAGAASRAAARGADRARRHRLATLAPALLAVVAGWALAGGPLQGWVVGLGMDDQRGALIAGLLLVLAAAAVCTAAGAGATVTRWGCLLGLCAVEVGPFLAGSTRVPAIPGLHARVVVWGWVVQPLGMLLMGWLTATAGAALGMLLRRDLLAASGTLRRRRPLWVAVLPALALVVVGSRAASTALQDGPLADLYSYATAPARAALPPQTAAAHHEGGPVESTDGSESRVSTPTVRSVHQLQVLQSGHLVTLVIGGREVDVYLPAAYDAEPSTSFPVVYFLHGYPGTETQWLTGGQLPGVLDQLISTRTVPPLIAVLPNGTGQSGGDAEWGDTAAGDTVEQWLTGQVIPAIDARYRTLGARYRGVAGLSAGGFGAVNLATRHPDLFGWAASYSGYFTARQDIFGDQARANSPAATVRQLSMSERMPLFIGIGSQDTEFLADNRRFEGELRRLGWAPLWTDVVPGGHGWLAWRLEMVHSLEWLGTLWGPSLSHPPAPARPPVA